jgi:hypothetical protein
MGGSQKHKSDKFNKDKYMKQPDPLGVKSLCLFVLVPGSTC